MVTDGRMDPMDGFELSRRAKTLRPDLRIAMVSAVFHDEDAGTSPIDCMFEKPLAVSSLVAWLQGA
jgi:CheY-like chemotaxis protein